MNFDDTQITENTRGAYPIEYNDPKTAGQVGSTPWRFTRISGASHLALLTQGWAVLENMSGQDWRDVEPTLVSGNPVTFRQALYAAYYVDRPEVPVEVLGRVLPAPDTGAIGLAD